MILQTPSLKFGSENNPAPDSIKRQAACSRCGGLLVQTFCVSPDEGTSDFQIPVAKCLQCGDVIDPVILKHRFAGSLPVPQPSKKRRWADYQTISNK